VIDFEPSDEQKLIVETVQQFAANEVRPQARPCDESGKLPDAVLAQAHELGLVANALPEDAGGGGERSAVTGALVCEELAWGDLAIAAAILSPALAAFPLADHGSDAQRKERLPAFCGEHFVPGALALCEPDLRADVFRPATRARRDGDAFVLTGRKCLVPWLDGGDVVLVSAGADDGPALFCVPRDAEGLGAERERLMGIRALPTAALRLEDVRVPAKARLPGGEEALRDAVARGRVAGAACAVGVARAAFETARDYAKEREAFGAPIASKQAIAFLLANMAIEIDGLRLLVWKAADALDRGRAESAARQAALCRQQAESKALEVCDGAVQVLGGHGYIREYLPEMHLRNARGFASFESLALV